MLQRQEEVQLTVSLTIAVKLTLGAGFTTVPSSVATGLASGGLGASWVMLVLSYRPGIT